MARRLPNLLTVLPLLLCAAVLASWWVSLRTAHSLRLHRGAREYRLVLYAGTVQLWQTRRFDAAAAPTGPYRVAEVPIDYAGGLYDGMAARTWWGVDMKAPRWWPVRLNPVAASRVGTSRAVQAPDGSVQVVSVEANVWATPHWLAAAALAAAAAPGVWAWASRRRAARNAHACVSCGYDLRASPGRCPECGAPSATSQ